MTKLLGHNKQGGVAADQLKSIIERVERLTQEKDDIAEDIHSVFAEAKSQGYSVPALRKIIKIRATDAQKREEDEYVLETYMRSLGMLPLFEGEGT